MTAVSRTAQFAKIHKVLKKYYKSAAANNGRSVVEHLLFACCLEDAHHDTAEEAFAALVHTFFDWNEVRVTSISELSEVMACLPDPRAAANRIKRVLHAVFEATFNFDLEDRRKKNLGPTVEWLEKLDGPTRFTVAYVVQAALGGHSIPIDTGSMAVLRILDVVTDADVSARVVPGLERAVAKSKGGEFGALLHELGADYSANPYSPHVREILLQVNPECAGRLPKRRVDRSAREQPAKAEKTGKEAKSPAAESKSKAAEADKAPAKKKPHGSESAPTPAPAKSDHESPKKKPVTHREHPAKPTASETSASSKKRPASEGLAKRKPR
jgi:endonuclease III